MLLTLPSNSNGQSLAPAVTVAPEERENNNSVNVKTNRMPDSLALKLKHSQSLKVFSCS
jgi:hypothetical protein